MKSWFYSLEPREQLSVLAAGAFIVFAVLYFSVWTPLDRGQSSLASSVATWERSLAELRPLKAAVRSTGGRGAVQAGAGQSLVVIVDTTLRNRSLGQPKRSQPTPNGIRVEFENVPFDDLVLWLGDLSTQYAMEVQSGSLSTAAQASPGRINATLTIERKL